jgi:hypothetical protein
VTSAASPSGPLSPAGAPARTGASVSILPGGGRP